MQVRIMFRKVLQLQIVICLADLFLNDSTPRNTNKLEIHSNTWDAY